MAEIREDRFYAEIKPDELVENPRKEWDHFGTMATWHPNYEFGEVQIDRYAVQEWFDENLKNSGAIWLPLYLYDHSGLSMSTDSFVGRAQHAEWDSGTVGFIYVSREAALKEFGGKYLTKKKIEKVKRILQGEVETFDSYLRGDVYYIAIKDRENDGEIVDSVGGFYGYEYAEEEAKGMLKEHNRQYLLAFKDESDWEKASAEADTDEGVLARYNELQLIP